MDRSTENDKNGKELKWRVSRIISESHYSSQFFDENILENFRKYFKHGPFYVETDPQLAFEGDT